MKTNNFITFAVLLSLTLGIIPSIAAQNIPSIKTTGPVAKPEKPVIKPNDVKKAPEQKETNETKPLPAEQQAKTPVQKQNYTAAEPLQIIENPTKYLNKNVKFKATFDKFSTLGLDYNKAMRESTKYIGFLIQRDDIVDHNIPLSEMKLFIKREYAEKFVDLDTGDKIEVMGRVFSDALLDPWIDVNEIVVLKKAKENVKK